MLFEYTVIHCCTSQVSSSAFSVVAQVSEERFGWFSPAVEAAAAPHEPGPTAHVVSDSDVVKVPPLNNGRVIVHLRCV